MFKIAIASGKGGTGKTFVSTNLFHALTERNQSVILADCDAEAPNAAAFFSTRLVETTEVTQLVPVIDTGKCTFCSRCHDYCNYNSIFILPPSRIISVIEDLCHGCGACIAACRDNAITEKPVSLGEVSLYSVNGNHYLTEAKMNIGIMSPVRVIKSAIRKTEGKADLAILDSPPGTSCPFIQTVASADYVILVTEPTPFGLSDLRQSVDTLRTMNKPCGVIINRSGSGNSEVNEYLASENIPLLLEIPFRKETAASYSSGELVVKTDNFFAEQLSQVVKNIISVNGDSNNQR